MKNEEKIGCGEMFCYMCDRLDESHSAYCSLHGRSAHYICGKNKDEFRRIKLCPSCQEKKDNQVVILDDNELSIMQYAKEFPDNWKKICKSLEKDNHNQVGQDVGAINQALMGNDNSLNPTAIQSPKIFEDVIKLIEYARTELIKAKQFNNSHDETHKDRIHFSVLDKILVNLKSKIKEKWRKI